MNISNTRNALKIMGLDPDVYLQSPDFLSRCAEIDKIDSKYLDAIAIAEWPKILSF